MEKEIIEKLKKLFKDRFGKSGQPRYEVATEHCPEDMTEGRTSWEEMRCYADEMKYFIEDIRSILYPHNGDEEKCR